MTQPNTSISSPTIKNYLDLCNAIGKKDPAVYLTKHKTDASIIEESDNQKWNAKLIKDGLGSYSVGVTIDASQLEWVNQKTEQVLCAANLVHLLAKRQFKNFELLKSTIKEWNEKYGRIEAIFNHNPNEHCILIAKDNNTILHVVAHKSNKPLAKLHFNRRINVEFDTDSHEIAPNATRITLNKILSFNLLLILFPEAKAFQMTEKTLGSISGIGPQLASGVHFFEYAFEKTFAGLGLKAYHSYEYIENLLHNEHEDHDNKDKHNYLISNQPKIVIKDNKQPSNPESSPQAEKNLKPLKPLLPKKSQPPATPLKTITNENIHIIENVATNAKADGVKFANFHSEAKEIHSSLKSLWDDFAKKDLLKGILETTNKLAFNFYLSQRHSTEKLERKIKTKNIIHNHESHVHNLKENAKASTYFSLPKVEGMFLRSISPYWSMFKHLNEIDQYLKDFNNTQKELNQLLESRRDIQKEGQEQSLQLDVLDQQIIDRYHHLLSRHETLLDKANHCETAFNLAHSFLSNVPLLGAAGNIVGIFGGHEQKHIIKSEQKLSRALSNSESTRAQLSHTLQINNQQIGFIQHTLSGQRAAFLASGHLGNPVVYRKQLIVNSEEINLALEESKQNIIIKNNELNEKCALKSKIDDQLKNIDASDPSKHHHHHLHKAKIQLQQNLAKTQAEILQIKLDLKNESTALSELEKEADNYKHARESADRLFSVKNYFYEEIRYQTEQELGNDKRTQEIRDALNQGFSELNFGVSQRRYVANVGFASVNQLFREVEAFMHLCNMPQMAPIANKMQVGASACELTYNLCDRFTAWKQGFDAIHGLMKGMEPGKTLVDAIQLMGPTLFIGNFITPGIQLVSLSLTLVRFGSYMLNGSAAIVNEQEKLIKDLSVFLESFSQNMSEQMSVVQQSLKNNHCEIMQALVKATELAGTYQNQVLHEIKRSHQTILNEIKNSQDLVQTLAIKKIRNKITAAGNKYKLKLETSKNKQKVLRNFLNQIDNWIETVTVSETNTGLIQSRGKSGQMDHFRSLVSIEEALLNPALYSSVIGYEIGFHTIVPSLFLLSSIAKFHKQMLSNIPSESLSEEDGELLITIDMKLQKQFKIVSSLVEQILPFSQEIYGFQNSVLESWENKMAQAAQMSDAYTDHIAWMKLKISAPEYANTLIGSKKFEIGNLLSKQFLIPQEAPKVSYNHSLKGSLYGSMANYGAAVAVAALLHPFTIPVALGIATINQFITNSVCAAADVKNYTTDQLYYEALKDLTPGAVAAMAKAQNNIKSKFTGYIKAEVTIAKHGILTTSLSKISKIADQALSTQYPIHPILPLHMVVHLSSDNIMIEILNDSIVKKKTLLAIHEIMENVQPSVYDEQVQTLKTTYETWLKSHYGVKNISEVSEWIENGVAKFKQLSEKAKVIVASNPLLPPLLLPQTLLNFCENQIKEEVALIAVKCDGFSFASYDFIYEEKISRYCLKLRYAYIQPNTQQELPFAEFQIASFDKQTVESFSLASLSGNKKQTPNLNEFLLQAMYPNCLTVKDEEKHCLGMPGAQTVILNKGQWIIPAEYPFPGLFELWNADPSQEIVFNHSLYTNQVSKDMCEQINSENLKSFFTPLSQKFLIGSIELKHKLQVTSEELLEQQKKLENNYKRLIALCNLASSMDDETTESALRSLGIIKPFNETNANILICAYDIRPKNPSDETVDNFLTILQNKRNKELNFI